MKAIILAGGKGTRLRPLTFCRQKQLLPIADKDLIYYIIEDLARSGIKNIGIVINPGQDQLREEVGNGGQWNISISYIIQPEPKGLAHALLCAAEFVDNDEFIMYLGDNLFSNSIKNFVEDFKNSEFDAKILLTHVKHPEEFGLAEIDNNRKVCRLVEKPAHPKTDLGIVGVYAFKPIIFEAAKSIKPSARGELEITDAIQWLIDNGKNVGFDLVQGWWEDTGNPADLLEANKLILEKLNLRNEGIIEEGAIIEGKVGIGKNTVIKAGSRIVGPTIIGENCEIKGNVGAFTSIGDNVKINNGNIDYSIILDNCLIEASQKISNSLIGANCKIQDHSEKDQLIIADYSVVKL